MTRLSRERSDRRAAVIKAPAHPSRPAIAEALQDGERCVQGLTDLAGADRSAVSKHLTVMRGVGLPDMEKRGSNIFDVLRCPCLMGFLDCVDSLAAAKFSRVKS